MCFWRIRSPRDIVCICIECIPRVAGGKSISFSLDSRYVAFSGVFSLVVRLDQDRIAVGSAYFCATNMRFSPSSMTHAAVLRNKIVFHLAAIEERENLLAERWLEEEIHDISYCQRGQRLAASMKKGITMLDVSNLDVITELFTVACEPGLRMTTPLGKDLMVIDRQDHMMSSDYLAA